MRHRFFVPVGALLVAVVVWLVPVPVAAQAATAAAKPKAAKTWTPPRTLDGQPDLQGVWDFRTITPLERPSSLGGKEVLSDEEAATFEAAQNKSQNRDLVDPKKGGAGYPAGGVVPYNEFWYDRGDKLTGPKRTSLIVDPADGRLPPRTPEGQKRAAARAEANRANQAGKPRADSYTDRGLGERCIAGFNAGPPMTPAAYNNNVQIFQTADDVAILNEMIHSARIVPLNGQVPASIRQGMGVPRGRWQGDTLVVESGNFARETSLAGSTANMKLTERFTRTGPDMLLYEFAVDDPTEWTRPWTAQIHMTKSREPMYEYACHEGNYALAGVLRGARAEEEAAAKKTVK